MINSFDINSLPILTERYDLKSWIGHGTYSNVHTARSLSTGKWMASKNVDLEQFQNVAIKEIQLMNRLKRLGHPNIVELLEVCRTVTNRKTSHLHLIMDQHLFDLKCFLSKQGVDCSLPNIKSIMQQSLNAICALHDHNIFHRDLKPENILLSIDGFVKLADFGLAGYFHSVNGKKSVHENNVITLNYRPPELLLGATAYGPEVDMWSAGCILAELLLGIQLFLCKTKNEQIRQISKLCGELSSEIWPDVKNLPFYKFYHVPIGPRDIKARLSLAINDESAKDLISKLLVLDPNRRYKAKEALSHDFFSTAPLPYNRVAVFSQRPLNMTNEEKRIGERPTKKIRVN